jgi:hypothetical protein
LKAYVLIQTATSGAPITQALRAIPGVVSAEDLNGPFDAIVLAGAGSTRKLMDGIVAEIRQLPGVIRAIPAPLIRSLGQGLEPVSASDHEAA